MVTFCRQVGCEQVSKLTVEGTPLHTCRRQIPGVRIRLADVRHETIVYVGGIRIDEHTHHTVGCRVDGLGDTHVTFVNNCITFQNAHRKSHSAPWQLHYNHSFTGGH